MTKSQTTRSLTTTLAIAFLTLIAAAILLASSLQLLSSIQTQRDAIATNQYLLARGAAQTVSNFIQEKFGVLDSAASLAIPVTVSPKAQRQTLESLLGLQPAFARLVLLDDQDQTVANATRIAQESWPYMDQIRDDILVQTKNGENYISSVYIDEITSEPMVVIAVPVTSALGIHQGTLIAELKLKFMWTVVDQLDVGKTGWAYVVDKQGSLLAFRDSSRVLKAENVRHLAIVDDFTQDTAGSGQNTLRTYQGLTESTVVGTYVPLETPNWAVVIEMPWQEAYRQVITEAAWALVITVAMAILASILGVVLARRLTASLVNLTETATRISQGELALQAEIGGPGEIVSLASAFNSMSSSLQDKIYQETTSRAVLEATVEEYLAFVRQVAQGDLTSFLQLDSSDNVQDKDNPLYTLGINLNLMVNSLVEMTAANEELLIETQEARDAAEEANRVKSQFLASMSHELRTPLNAILNFNEMMALGMVGSVNEQQVDVLNKSLDSGRHLLALINDVLDVTKIQSGTLTLFVEEDVNLQAILENVSHTAETLLRNQSVKFIKNIEDDLPAISGDKRRIRQVLLNLLSNAIKFTEEGEVILAAKRQDSNILFSVSDTGPGISKDQEVVVFEPFIQTDTGIRHAGGTGLGLPISKSFVEAHGGKLWLESEAGKGTTFYFTLPIHAAVSASARN